MENLRNVKVPPVGGAGGSIARAVIIGGAVVYGAVNSLFNVEGGHRAIMFNRFVGVKDTVRVPQSQAQSPAQAHVAPAPN